MIQIRNVRHAIQGTEILSETTLAIPAGKITALIGPNGAGKSTLLSLMGRLQPLGEGAISIDDLDVSATPTDTLARKVAIMTQKQHLGSRLRVGELVGFGRWPHHKGRPGPADHAMIEQALDEMDLSDMRHRFIDSLSGGQQQRAFLAMARAQDTDWLFLDEPINNLDMAHAGKLMRQLDALRRAGKSIVIVLHDVNYAACWADHIIAMKDGAVRHEGAPEEVLTKANIHGLYGIDVEVTTINGKLMVLHHLGEA
ncbi:ABC transporter ATP-binding protein [Paracoccaceae bacterium GXU_MW_L88]